MSNQTIKARIQLKNDTEEHWAKAVNFCPLRGEVIIYSADELHPFPRLKVGDGETTVTKLPFLDNATLHDYAIEVDTTANWQARPTYIPKKDTILIYTDKAYIEKDGQLMPVPGIKVSDGLAYGIDQPFVGDELGDALTVHVDDDIRHITNDERAFWNEKINCEDDVINEVLTLKRN